MQNFDTPRWSPYKQENNASEMLADASFLGDYLRSVLYIGENSEEEEVEEEKSVGHIPIREEKDILVPMSFGESMRSSAEESFAKRVSALGWSEFGSEEDYSTAPSRKDKLRLVV